MDIKRRGDESLFIRTTPGRYTLRTLAAGAGTETTPLAPAAMRASQSEATRPGAPMAALPARKPAVAASSSTPARVRTDNDVGNGFAG
jgi:hypothetical protein